MSAIPSPSPLDSAQRLDRADRWIEDLGNAMAGVGVTIEAFLATVTPERRGLIEDQMQAVMTAVANARDVIRNRPVRSLGELREDLVAVGAMPSSN